MSLFWIVTIIVLLGLMVLVHEWGHFMVAKLCRVRVEIFSIGFGPRLLGRRRGSTDYRLSALPFGGYVKMAGDNLTEERAGAPDEFLSKPRWQRVLIVLGGPVMNIVAAVLILAGVFAFYYERPAALDEPAVIGAVRPDSAAARAGLQPGDRIVRIGPAREPTWEEALLETDLAIGRGSSLPLEIERAGARRELELGLPSEGQEDPFEVGWIPDYRFMVHSVSPGSPAEKAGLRAGDLLLAMNGESLRPTVQGDSPLPEWLQRSAGQPVTLTIERQGLKQEITAAPIYGDHPEGRRWILGLSHGPRTVRKALNPWEALKTSVETNVKLGAQMLDLVGRLFTGRASLRSVQGPVGIVHVGGEVGERGGWLAVTNLMSVLSLSLGILNLLPIPILDGGHILVFSVEGLLGRDLSLRLKERLIQAGFVFLMLVIVFVMYNDIRRIVTN